MNLGDSANTVVYQPLLERITHAVLYCALTPLKGHREEIGNGICKGSTFLELIRLLANTIL